jgi:paraquat-inducible protein B
MRVEMGSLATLFGGGVSFDIPEGLDMGEPVANKTGYHLFDDQKSIQDSVFTQHIDYVMFFKDSCAVCSPGRRSSSVESAWVPSVKCRSLFQDCIST